MFKNTLLPLPTDFIFICQNHLSFFCHKVFSHGVLKSETLKLEKLLEEFGKMKLGNTRFYCFALLLALCSFDATAFA